MTLEDAIEAVNKLRLGTVRKMQVIDLLTKVDKNSYNQGWAEGYAEAMDNVEMEREDE